MDTCTIEVGLLKKHPCGQNAVTKCANCEQPLCAKHATSMMSGGRKTMLCSECAKAWKDMGEVPTAAAPVAKKPAEAPKAAHAPAPAHAPKPAAPAPKPAAAAAPKPAASKPAAAPAAPKPAPTAAKPDDTGLDKKPELSIDMTGPLEFTPSKKPEEKK